MKQCRWCRLTKPAEDFRRTVSGKLLASCRACEREANRKSMSALRRANPGYVKAERDRYKAADPARWKAQHRKAKHIRRARERGRLVEGVDPRVVWDRDKGVCGICQRPIDPNGDWHMDHVIPLAQGGVHSYANVQAAHPGCNYKKSDSVPEGYIAPEPKPATERYLVLTLTPEQYAQVELVAGIPRVKEWAMRVLLQAAIPTPVPSPRIRIGHQSSSLQIFWTEGPEGSLVMNTWRK